MTTSAALPKAPWHLVTAAWLTLAWGVLSGGDHAMSFAMGEAYYKASGMTDSQIAYFGSLPAWVNAAWAASVWGGLAAALALLLRRRVSTYLFAASALGTLLYVVHTYFLSPGIAAMGAVWFMPCVIGIIMLALTWYTATMSRRRLLR